MLFPSPLASLCCVCDLQGWVVLRFSLLLVASHVYFVFDRMVGLFVRFSLLHVASLIVCTATHVSTHVRIFGLCFILFYHTVLLLRSIRLHVSSSLSLSHCHYRLILRM